MTMYHNWPFRRLLAIMIFLSISSIANAQVPIGPIGQQPPQGAENPIFYSSIPFVVPGNSSMANNGALTPGTALPIAYDNAYFWMPTGWIAAASTAGWYFTQCSTTTACTVFNNTYTSNSGAIPTIPASPTSFVTTGPGAGQVQTTGSPIEIFNGPTVPGNSLGLNGRLTTDAQMAYTNSGGTKNFLIKYSTTNVLNQTFSTTVTTRAQSVMVNTGKASAQTFLANATGTSFTSSTNGASKASVDTTQDQSIDASIQLNTATDNAVLQSLYISTVKLQ